MEEKIDAYLQDLWEDMMEAYNENLLKFLGAVNMAWQIGLITKEKHELWLLRIKNCPDTDHCGGRIWCAYCGNIELKEE